MWRSFAREIRGDRWETSTPGEIQREAIATGYPAHPVDTLSETFRAVEYGDRPLTTSVYEHARVAYRSIAFWHDERDGGEDG
ncbi:MAG: DUF4129 domain-containing protein [Natrialbaceae archaeon]|nr:DUF4129 domain-containing protein [Natrialbaceae archaeon]